MLLPALLRHARLWPLSWLDMLQCSRRGYIAPAMVYMDCD